jgi:hypothetical protein
MMNKSVHLLVELNGSEELVRCGVEEGRRKGGFHEPFIGDVQVAFHALPFGTFQ